jgi:hypothetical protein
MSTALSQLRYSPKSGGWSHGKDWTSLATEYRGLTLSLHGSLQITSVGFLYPSPTLIAYGDSMDRLGSGCP